MQHGEPKVRFKSIKISIIVQKDMFFFYTKCSDETVNRSSNGETKASQDTVIQGSSPGQSQASYLEEFKLTQLRLHLEESSLAADSLQHLAEGQTCDPDSLSTSILPQPQCLRVSCVPQMIDQHRRINDDHAR
jgi:hypothetical protein